jgi:cobalt/nickel transport system permease protein
MSRGFLESTTLGFARLFTEAMLSERIARKRGLLQSLDPRVRVLGLFSLVLAVTLCRRVAAVAALFVVAVLLAAFSRVSPAMLARRVWWVVLVFTGVIALPAVFLTPGTAAGRIAGFAVTEQGLRTACLLILRVETAVTLTALLVLCTPWNLVLKSLRTLRLPKEAVVMLAMTYRYIFLLVETAAQMFESRRSRTVGVLTRAEQRHMAARTAGVLLSKSIGMSNEVYLAMQSRGFGGDVQVLPELRVTMWDIGCMLAFLLVAVITVWVGR